MAITTTPQSFDLLMELGFDNDGDLLRYTESTSSSAAFGGQSIVNLLASTNNQAVNFATLFPGLSTVLAWGFKDMSNPGVGVSFKTENNGTNKIAVNPNGGMVFRQAGTAPPTIYFDNASGSVCNLLIAVIGS